MNGRNGYLVCVLLSSRNANRERARPSECGTKFENSANSKAVERTTIHSRLTQLVGGYHSNRIKTVWVNSIFVAIATFTALGKPTQEEKRREHGPETIEGVMDGVY